MINVEKFREYVQMERAKQDAKWGVQNHKDEKWHVIGSEEWGEGRRSDT